MARSDGRIAGRVALVTGAAQGIGRAIALRLAEEGARLVLVDIDVARLAATAAEVCALGAEALAAIADCTEEADVARAVETGAAAFGAVEILVNNVGGGRAGRLWELTPEDWDAVMRLNLRPMFLFTRAVVRPMIERGAGRIICLSSGARNGTVWNAYHRGSSAYSTAKAGVHGFIRDMAIELADHGITVNAVAPGAIDTELAGPYLRHMEEEGLEFSPVRMTPLRRLGTPREVADAVLYLASDEASYVTGITLDVLGGR
jgi:NAD(P)-dependent dehydrogenase (short-subunit alcohol dehydrogenase family)